MVVVIKQPAIEVGIAQRGLNRLKIHAADSTAVRRTK
jgi:hypothetical protein